MSKTNSLKEIYKLQYDTHSPQSGLIHWYNRLIEKRPDELDVTDVSKMLRQNILTSLVIDRAIEIFVADPFIGEMYDGELLSLFVMYNAEVIKSKNLHTLATALTNLEDKISQFDWFNPQDKENFNNHLKALKTYLNKQN